MKDNSNHIRLFNESKKRARESEERILIHNIVDSISTRRHRDLFDILTEIEQHSGWSSAIEYLIKANGKTYSYNMGSKGSKVQLEPLKYREVIFKLFRCEGLEPVKIETISLLEEISNELSMIDATNKFAQRVEELTWNQIKKNDLLFFDPFYDNIMISNNLRNHIADFQRKEIKDLVLWKTGDRINIEALWHSELGRQALSSIGSQGLSISSDEISRVLTLIQVSPKPLILNFDESKENHNEIVYPSQEEYKLLLNFIIEKKPNELEQLGSKHSIPIFNNLLFDALEYYENNTSSKNYQNVLNMMVSHVMIREVDSISILEQLSQLEDKRIATIAIISLGNFFHESAALALINLVCNKRNNEIIDNAIIALENLCMNSPESILMIKNVLKTNCTNYNKLKNLHKRISK
jgi:hypothetical protein